MNTHTRLFFGAAPQGPRPQRDVGTLTFGAPPPPGARAVFEQHWRLMRSAHLEERRPGAFLFVVAADGRQVGRMWLAATDAPRAATLGRHEAVELPVAVEAALSLRHLLFVVRRVAGRVRASLVDLESSSGLHTLHGAEHSLETEGPALLRTAHLSFFCAPTGPGAALPLAASAAWPLFSAPPPAPSLFQALLARPERRVGALSLAGLPLAVDLAMATRGVLLGRDPRCDVIVADPCASRVHAAVLGIDGVPHLIDVGSSNGTWLETGERVRCAPLGPASAFFVGRARVEWRAGA